MDTSFTNTKESLATARLCETDWASLTRAQQIQSIELDGFVVIPDLLSPDMLETVREERCSAVTPICRSAQSTKKSLQFSLDATASNVLGFQHSKAPTLQLHGMAMKTLKKCRDRRRLAVELRSRQDCMPL